ncbi:hypothetical protein [Corynebacterium sp. H78]|uniref:hypothetical protein n=1 Tax=Corynebacterium sp. H78 TaxID=3133417 RepID=UPI00309CD042
MMFIAFALAAVLFVAAVVLLIVDAKRRKANTPTDASTTAVADDAGATLPPAHPKPATQPEARAQELVEVQPEQDPEAELIPRDDPELVLATEPFPREPADDEPEGDEPEDAELGTDQPETAADVDAASAASFERSETEKELLNYANSLDSQAAQLEMWAVREQARQEAALAEQLRKAAKIREVMERQRKEAEAARLERMPSDPPATDTTTEAVASSTTGQDFNADATADAATDLADDALDLSDDALNADEATDASDHEREPRSLAGSMSSLGLGHRRARKQWAKQRHADYRRIDHGVTDLWERIPEGEAKAVVFGFAHGREMHVCDVGQVTIVALRRASASDEVVELRHNGDSALPTVSFESGLLMSATNPTVIRRIMDSRASEFFGTVPEFINVMWAEGDWLLAELSRDSVAEEWDIALQVLSEFSDFARRLPPVEDRDVELDPEQWDQTRELARDREAELEPATEESAAEVSAIDVDAIDATDTEDDAVDAGQVSDADSDSATDGDNGEHTTKPVNAEGIGDWRPSHDTPLNPEDLPSRSKPRFSSEGPAVDDADATSFRDVEFEAAGIPALGEDPEHMRSRITGGRIIRPATETPGIFADGIADSDLPEGDDENNE